MAGAQLQPILNRVNSVENYHPFTAETHADWSLEAGDIVTVSREGTQYSSPVHTTTLHWAGKQQVTVESRGEKERGPISKLAAREYASGGNAYRSGARGGGRRKQLEEDVGEITDSNLWVERDHITAVSGTYEIDKFGNLIIKEGSGLYMNRNNAVFGVFDEGNLTGGIMAQRINGQTETLIRGDRVSIGNSNATTVINGKLDADKLESSIAALTSVQVKNLTCTGSIYVGNGAGQSTNVGYAIDEINIKPSGNNYILQISRLGQSGWTDVGSFSRATSLRGRWSGGTYTVTATPQGNTNTATIKQLTQSGSVSVIGKNVGQDVSVYATENGGSGTSTYTGFRQQVWIDASAVYTNGYNDGKGSVSTRPSVVTNTSTSPSGATNLGNVLYISSSVQSVVITVGGNKWYARVTK